MKPEILKQLPEEVKTLYEISKKRKVDRRFFAELRYAIREVKGRYSKSKHIDVLQNKLDNYGNKGSWGLNKIQELSMYIYNDKLPGITNLGQWVSVEIEAIAANKMSEKQFVAFVRKKGWTKFVTIKDDGSIHPSSGNCECEELDDSEDYCECGAQGYGREIVITFQYGDWKFVKAICEELNRLKFTVNRTCGLHVHFDCRHLTARQVTTLGKKVARTVPALKQILPASRQNNEFCETTINSHRGSSRRDARYAFVNLMSYGRHKTIEIRGHSGTTDAVKIINWIRILRTIMDSKNKNEIYSVSELVNTFNFGDELLKYITSRYEKFNNKKAMLSDDVSLDNHTPMNVEYITTAIENSITPNEQARTPSDTNISLTNQSGEQMVRFDSIGVSASAQSFRNLSERLISRLGELYQTQDVEIIEHAGLRPIDEENSGSAA